MSEAEIERRTETVPQWKRKEVDELRSFLERYESVGIVDVSGIPSRQLQAMRADIHGSAAVRMSRNTLLRRALEEVDDGLEALAEHVSGQVALVGTNANPFGLYRQLEASKTPAPINAGEIAPNDIVIPAGDTGIDPGPFVGELQAIGAAAQIMEGSIRVTQSSVVAEAGEEVDDQLATVLAELEIEPKEVGLDLRAVYSDGVQFAADELAIDVDAYRADIQAAVARGRALSIEAAYPTGRTMSSLLSRASAQAKSLGLAAAIESPALADDLVSRADAQVRAIAALIDDEEALPAELQGMEVTETQTTEDTEPDEPTEEATDEPTETEATDEDPADDEEAEDASGEGLGDLFG